MTTTIYARHPSPSAAAPGRGAVPRRRDGADRLLPSRIIAGARASIRAWREDPAAFAGIGAAIDAQLGGRPGGDADGARRASAMGTPFQRRAWEALRSDPRRDDRDLRRSWRRASGGPGAARAVGSAVARNPISIVVPCHRVVGADGSLTGYAGGSRRSGGSSRWSRGRDGAGADGGRAASLGSAGGAA